MSPYDPAAVARRAARVAAQHWDRPTQRLTNAAPIPRRSDQVDCHVAAQAYLVWADDGPATITTHAYAWAPHPTLVLVEVRDTRHPFVGAWLHPWDVWPAGGIGGVWTTMYGTRLDAPPWAG